MPNDGHSRLPVERYSPSSTWVLGNTKDSTQSDRAQRSHSESTGSFHWFLPQLLSGNRSGLAPGGPDDRSRPRAAGRRGAWRDRPRPSAPSAPGTSRAARGSRPAPRTPPRPRIRRPRTAAQGMDRTPGRQDRSRLAAPDAAEGSVDPARPESRSLDP